MAGIDQVVAIAVVVDVHLIGQVPVVHPELRPGIHHEEPVTPAPEPGIALVDHRAAADAEGMPISEAGDELRLGDAVAAVAPTLGPGPVVTLPLMSAMLPPTGAGGPRLPAPGVPGLPGAGGLSGAWRGARLARLRAGGLPAVGGRPQGARRLVPL